MSELAVLSRFIAIEGLDGAGTSTQAEALTKALNGDVWRTFEPTDGEIGSLIRRILGKEVAATPQTVAHLYAADRAEHLYRPQTGILSRLEAGATVVTDRYLFSSLAYQSVECGFDFVLTLNASFPLPRHLFYLDIDPSVGEKRLATRSFRDIYEETSFQEKVHHLYERTLDHFTGTGVEIHRIDGTLEVETITRSILAALSWHPA